MIRTRTFIQVTWGSEIKENEIEFQKEMAQDNARIPKIEQTNSGDY